MRRIYVAVVSSFLPFSVAAVAPISMDYANGLDLTAEVGKPLQEITLPEVVYAGVRRADLSDLRVFNAEGLGVPYALCVSPEPVPPQTSNVPLRVFPLKAARVPEGTGRAHVEVEPSGHVDISVQRDVPRPADPAAAIDAYVIDAREVQVPLQALRVDWHSSDGASELQVRVEASDDLDHWFTLTAQSTLLHADAGGQNLDRALIPLPPGRYKYLRLARNGSGPQPELDGVSGEVATVTIQPAQWFDSVSLSSKEPKVFLFDAGHLAPASSAQVDLPSTNMSMRVSLQSRSQEQTAWRTAWSGEVFALVDGPNLRRNPEIHLGPTSDRWWRLEILQGADSLGGGTPRLRLGYFPARLRFLAQGNGPYLLAFGSERAEPARVQNCDSLVADVKGTELPALLGHAVAGQAHALGGNDALKPAPRPTPIRQIVLWVVLILGVAVLLGMSFGLLKRVRKRNP